MKARPRSTSGGADARVVRDILLIFGSSLAVGLLLKIFLVGAFFVPSRSMETTLLPGDFVLVNRLAYGLRIPRCLPAVVIPISRSKTFQFSSPRRGDIIAFEKPAPDALACEAPTLLKRCAALPGDTLFFSENSIRLPGFTIEIPALEHAPPSGSIVLPRAGETIALSAGSARFFQALIEEEGHTVMVDQDGLVRLDDFPASEYTVSQDAYFVLGDNRSSSLDSRFFGAVPAGRIVGKAFLIYWSRSDARERDAFGNPFEGVRWTRIGTLLH